jgi:hypothetical protein
MPPIPNFANYTRVFDGDAADILSAAPMNDGPVLEWTGLENTVHTLQLIKKENSVSWTSLFSQDPDSWLTVDHFE